ncbi:anti-sigma B factor RsbW [Caldibacillus lycopersici]|uniref:Serine-protein kinase RsbW n=1 Tax=Perspicuibacillus lycopersici TaxID=1325689 RepID=A0AAE3IXG5_9BACI|nr:anti-sigma B factor RsbW [Perspicuibacillus lycopersici]MCU9615169.1 anti-sigma B factor RsbW [Perspicuibacillus lycopersici]
MNQPVDVVEVKLPPKPEFVGVARLTTSGIANRMGFSYEAIEDMKIAVSEAITNAIQHAYKQEENGTINLHFHIYSKKLEIIVSDKGESFDVAEVRGKTRPYHQDESIEFMREGGLGLFLIETLMDEVEFHQEDGVSVQMTKFLEREQVEMDAEAFSPK